VGQKLLENRDPLTGALIATLLAKYRRMLSGLRQAERLDVSEKQTQIADMIKSLESLKEVCDSW